MVVSNNSVIFVGRILSLENISVMSLVIMRVKRKVVCRKFDLLRIICV